MTTTTSLGTTPATPAPNWDRALCAQTDPALFFPEGRGGQITNAIEAAKRVCRRCPIRTACLEWAVASDQRFGVWGGLDEQERQTLGRKRSGERVAYALCIDAQDFIERRVSEGASHRTIADELGVGHHAVGRAWRYFQSEKDTAAAGQGVAA
ncbi:WhiB family transcriptional regulator [Streptomyces violaceorubidus]|uniref:WhiB family transcriptional regulator n=1 Tax=Streptomyces violaceorubidus TaxID=284042 RepID=UPI0007C71213|nr:WhiB family transcriptional regulator [Streptomyces violaceorubidus]